MPSTGDIVRASDFQAIKPQLSIGTVTTGAAGTNASASVTGTTPNFVLNLTIPRGNTGATGATGPQGPSGTYTGPLKPTTSYWQACNNRTLPAGGTWVYFGDCGNNYNQSVAGVAAGGSTFGNSNYQYSGFCWRIQ